MEEKILKRIRLIENKIEASLIEEDFICISALSIELETLIKECAASLNTADNFKDNTNELEKISRKLDFFKNQTKIGMYTVLYHM